MAMVKTKRRSMWPARRKRIHEAHDGICGWCHEEIGADEPFEIDHGVPLALGGADDDGPNAYPIHERCHHIKTFGLQHRRSGRRPDISAIAKVERLRARRLGLEARKPSRLSHPTLKRQVGGGVVRRSGGCA